MENDEKIEEFTNFIRAHLNKLDELYIEYSPTSSKITSKQEQILKIIKIELKNFKKKYK